MATVQEKAVCVLRILETKSVIKTQCRYRTQGQKWRLYKQKLCSNLGFSSLGSSMGSSHVPSIHRGLKPSNRYCDHVSQTEEIFLCDKIICLYRVINTVNLCIFYRMIMYIRFVYVYGAHLPIAKKHCSFCAANTLRYMD